MIAVPIFPVFYFFFLKLNLFPVLHCALFSLSAYWALLDCVIDRKVQDVIFEAILSPSERYQNIQDNPEYNSVLPFRIIFAVNMLLMQDFFAMVFQGKIFWVVHHFVHLHVFYGLKTSVLIGLITKW